LSIYPARYGSRSSRENAVSLREMRVDLAEILSITQFHNNAHEAGKCRSIKIKNLQFAYCAQFTNHYTKHIFHRFSPYRNLARASVYRMKS
jgi:hypothetical protein